MYLKSEKLKGFYFADFRERGSTVYAVMCDVSVACVFRMTRWYHVQDGTVLPVSVFQPKEQWLASTQQPIRAQLDDDIIYTKTDMDTRISSVKFTLI